MSAAEPTIARYRRPWKTDVILTGVGYAVALFVAFGLGKANLLWFYVPYSVLLLWMNRRQGLELTATRAVVRRPYRRTRTLRRDEISDVTLEQIGRGVRMLALRDGSGNQVKVTVNMASGEIGRERCERMYREVRQWWTQSAPSVREPAQMPGSASI